MGTEEGKARDPGHPLARWAWLEEREGRVGGHAPEASPREQQLLENSVALPPHPELPTARAPPNRWLRRPNSAWRPPSAAAGIVQAGTKQAALARKPRAALD